MAHRKTISVQDLKIKVNHLNFITPNELNLMGGKRIDYIQQREGWNSLLESVLMETGNYKGYRNLSTNDYSPANNVLIQYDECQNPNCSNRNTKFEDLRVGDEFTFLNNGFVYKKISTSDKENNCLKNGEPITFNPKGIVKECVSEFEIKAGNRYCKKCGSCMFDESRRHYI